jgi:hypothetical protein
MTMDELTYKHLRRCARLVAANTGIDINDIEGPAPSRMERIMVARYLTCWLAIKTQVPAKLLIYTRDVADYFGISRANSYHFVNRATEVVAMNNNLRNVLAVIAKQMTEAESVEVESWLRYCERVKIKADETR